MSTSAPRSRLRVSLPALIGLMLLVGAILLHVVTDERVTLEGTMREGSLRCTDACHFELVVVVAGEHEREQRVRARSCIMPDTLRDWPGRPMRVMVAGTFDSDVVVASSLLTRDGYAKDPPHSPGRPPECFIPSPKSK